MVDRRRAIIGVEKRGSVKVLRGRQRKVRKG
jgi:hypothetical protein